jgi:hypothetical protein
VLLPLKSCDPFHLHIKRYNLYKVLACSSAFFQLSLFCATFFQLCMFMLFISSKTSSSQHVFGLPIVLLDMGFHPLFFCTLIPCDPVTRLIFYAHGRSTTADVILSWYFIRPVA